MFKTLYYETIDELPAHNYFVISEQKDLTPLVKKKGLIKKKLESIYEAIQAQIINRFGINEQYLQIINLRQQITCLEVDYYLRGDTSAQTFIEILQQELKEILDVSLPDKNETKSQLEKYLGFKLNLKEISVAEYFTYIKQIQKSNGK